MGAQLRTLLKHLNAIKSAVIVRGFSQFSPTMPNAEGCSWDSYMLLFQSTVELHKVALHQQHFQQLPTI